MPANENDPVTDPSGITNRDQVTLSPVADNQGITKPADKQSQNAKAKPAIDTLFVYDTSLGIELPTALRDAYYQGAKLVGVSDWNDLVGALSKYSTIKTLVLDTHSTPGNLLLGGSSPTTSDQSQRLASSGVTVTGATIFEGCEMMGDPAAAAKLVAGISGPSARTSGYTLYTVIQGITLTLTGNEDAEGINTALEPHRIFLMPGGRTAQQLAGTSGDVTFYKRWFRADLDATPAPDVLPGNFPPREYKTHGDMTAKRVTNAKEAADVKADFESPVAPTYFVTVTNIEDVKNP